VKQDREAPSGVRTAAAIAFVVALGFGVVAPALPILAQQFGAGNVLVGLAISAMAAMRFASAVINGRLVARFGERAVLKWGLLLQGATTIAAGLAPNFELIVAYRAIGGVGSSAFTIAAMALVMRLAPADARGRSVGLFQTGFMLGAIVGPGVGGVLADINSRLPFIAYGVMLFVAAGIGHFLLPAPSKFRATPDLRVPEEPDGMPNPPLDGRPSQTRLVDIDADNGRMLRRPVALAMLAVLLVNFGHGWIGYGLRNSLIPVFAYTELSLNGTVVGLCLLATAVTQVAFIRTIASYSDRRGRKPLILAGAALSVVSMVLLALAPAFSWFLASMVLMGVAASALTTAPAAALADLSDSQGAARNVARFNMAADLGAICGPVIAGVVADAASFQLAFLLSAGVVASGLLVSACMPETNSARTRPDAT
jgi:MFS family permease